jgi:hypothetical protein
MKRPLLFASVGIGSLSIGLGLLFCHPPAVLAAVKPAAAPKAAAPQAPVANPNAGQALEIGPPVLTLKADPGQTIKAQLNLRDVSSGNLLVKGQVNDFLAAGEDGTPKIIMEDSKEVSPYSIKGWVPALPSFVIVPKQIKTMDITFNVPANASPGGHYGVIRFTATPPELHDTGVSLSASLGALVLITVSGQTTENLNIKEFTVSKDNKTGWLFQSTPLTFTERLQNTGNVHEQPVGQIAISNMFGKKVANVNVNLPPRNVLPASIRKFQEPLDKEAIGTKKLFGRYTAKLTVVYGTNKQQTVSSISFWVLPYKLILIIIIVLVAGFFILRLGLRSYNRRIVGRAYNSRRRR